MAIYCVISDIKRNIGQKPGLFYTPMHSIPPLGGPCWNITITFGTEKTRMVWLVGEKSLMICLAVSTQYRRVTDGRTDRQTDRHLAKA